MSKLRRNLRQTLTVARRDFVATVATPTFLIFLLAPLIMIGFGVIGGIGAATMTDSGSDRARIVAIVAPERAETISAVDAQLRELYSPLDEDRPPTLRVDIAGPDPLAQARALFDGGAGEATAVLFGPLERPHILRAGGARGDAGYLAQLAEQTLRAERAGGPGRLSDPIEIPVTREAPSASGKGQTAFFGVFGLFFLTLMLSGQAVGTMAEERSNKVIEVLAAAVPLESVFFGKLIGTFGVALLFLGFWGTLGVNAVRLIPGEIGAELAGIGPAVGLPMFALLFLAYFTMAFMLLSAVFLGMGAQASNQREIQMMSLPITIFQVAMFGLSSAAASSPGSWVATAAEIFPFSSPFAMIGRAANSPELWRHALALAWQLLWVALTIAIGARWFRRGVLKSGPARRRRTRAERLGDTAVDIGVS